ncbi:hypothetical protein JRC04_25735 [Mycolicibacterium sp. S2-37]|uniref:hypothetical protein n=1 Tax=Mycolicibacterium sp. S2-37 TaxID=2810297 RepID=UPI001A9441CF|nr:hypothetical protein [Mycolicibacterium sp. S2-37]MBO0680883.1 hypothetical protein [Mycolicibacterium sp. S2-37]
MLRPAIVVVSLACLGMPACAGSGSAGSTQPAELSLSIGNADGELASVALTEDRFAIGYRNSLYGTWAEERYAVQPDGSYTLVQIAADQLALLEEYYSLPGAPRPADPADRRDWIADPDPGRPGKFTDLSLAATDLGQRTLLVPGNPPLELWTLVDDDRPFVVLTLKETL